MQIGLTRSHFHVLAGFQRRTDFVLQSQMVLQVPARDQKFIDHTQYHTITQLYSHIVQKTDPLDTVYIIIHHCPSFSIIVHHESKQVASLHLLARNPLTASGDN